MNLAVLAPLMLWGLIVAGYLLPFGTWHHATLAKERSHCIEDFDHAYDERSTTSLENAVQSMEACLATRTDADLLARRAWLAVAKADDIRQDLNP